jgi:hypothetical protein
VYDVPVAYLLRAVAAALVIGVAGGLAFALLVRPLAFGFLYLAAMAGLGYGAAEGVSAAVARKRGRTIQIVAMGSVLLAEIVIVYVGIFPGGTIGLFDLLGAGLGMYVAYIRLR